MGWLKEAWYWPRQHKEFAADFWSEKASREYDKGRALMMQPGTRGKLLGALHKAASLAFYGAAGTAENLASESLGGWAFDLAAMGKGKLLAGVVAEASKLLARGVPAVSTTAKALDIASKVSRQWPEPGSALFRGRKAMKLGSLAARAMGQTDKKTAVTSSPVGGTSKGLVGVRTPSIQSLPSSKARVGGPFTFTHRNLPRAIVRPGKVVFTGGTEITARSRAYVPGAESRAYRALAPDARADVNAQANRLFQQQSGVTRKLTNGPEDLAYRRQWLRARDQVMQKRGW